MMVRADSVLAMQARHTDGRIYSSGESMHYPLTAVEGIVFQETSETYLLLWLQVHHAISTTNESGLKWTSNF